MNINIMTIVYVLFVILYLAFIYYRMIKREIPKPIGWVMALVPIAFGMATFDISGFTGIKLYLGNAAMHEFVAKLPAVLGSLLGAFLGAGLPEEIYKGIVLIIAILIFKPKKVYEYCLMGAAVGFATNSCVVALPKYNFIPVKPEISKVAIPKAIGTKAITHPIGLGISLLIIL